MPSTWVFILFEVFRCEAGSAAVNGANLNKHIKSAFSIMRFFVTAGWYIYALVFYGFTAARYLILLSM